MENTRKEMRKNEFKKIVKQGFRNNAFTQLVEIKLSHDKVRFIEHNNINKPEKYLLSSALDNKQKQLLYNLRCRSETEFKVNFHNIYQNLDCLFCSKREGGL